MSSVGTDLGTEHQTGRRHGEPEFFWSASRQASAERLLFAIQSWSPLTVVTGTAGCGKTRLVQEVLRRSDFGAAVGVIWDPAALERDPATSLADAFRETQAGGIDKVLLIDGTQSLPVAALEEICGLVEPLDLRLVLVGRPPLLDHVRGTPGAPLGPSFEIPDFTKEETGEYARFLFASAVETREHALDDTVAGAIFARSNGKPGAIREICRVCIHETGQGNHGAMDADFIRRLPLDGKSPHFPRTAAEPTPPAARAKEPAAGAERHPQPPARRAERVRSPSRPATQAALPGPSRMSRVYLPLALGAAGFLVAVLMAGGPQLSSTISAVTGIDPVGWFADRNSVDRDPGSATPEDPERQ